VILGHGFRQASVSTAVRRTLQGAIADLEDLLVAGERLELQRAVSSVVEGPGAAHIEPRTGGVGEGGGHRGARGGVGGEVHEPVGVEAVYDEGPPGSPQVRASALHHRPLVGVRRHDGDAGGEEDTTEEGHARRC